MATATGGAGWVVLFDMDGVLVGSGEAHFEGWLVACREAGVTMTREFFYETFGQRNDTIIPRLFDRPVTQEESERFSEAKERAYREIVRNRIEAVPGAPELVAALRAAGVPMAVGSSAPMENVSLVLRALDLESSMSAVVSGSDVKRGKPDPEVFLTAAGRLGARPDRCVVVEDAPDGVAAARAAGMKCLAVSTTRPAHLLGDADRVMADLRDVTVSMLAGLVEAVGRG